MSELVDALRKRFRTPAEAAVALGLDAALLTQETKPMPLSPQALMAKRVLNNYLRPRLAQDARIDLDPILRDVSERNWKPAEIARAVKSRVRSKMAQDADLTEIAKALAAVAPTMAGVDPGGDPVVTATPPEVMPQTKPDDIMPDALPVGGMPPNAGLPAAMPVAAPVVPPAPVAAPPKAKDAGECESWLAQAYPDIAAEWQSKSGGSPAPGDDAGAEDEDPDDPDDINGTAQDRTTGGANVARGKRGVTGDEDGPAMQPPDTKKPNIPGMDAAIKRERDNQREIMKAQREVRPWVGDFAMDAAFDAPHEVFKRALDTLRVPTDGIHPSAYRPILQAQPKPGLNRPAPQRVAQDSGKGNGESFLDRFPEARNATVG